MHRSAAVLAVAALLTLAACGGDDDATDSTPPAGGSTTVSSAASVPGTQSGSSEPGGSSESSIPEVSLAPVESVPSPSIDLPDEIPTELIVTELEPGGCRQAADGDTVVVNYVGVRSEDGTEFDSNIGGNPFPVTLGAGGVIEGWERGLTGAEQGARLQLDIPADLAYGDQPQGDVIQAGDALTFVIDVLAVVPATTADQAPTDVEIPTVTGATEVTFEDLVEGDTECGTAAAGSTAIAHLIAARADNGTIVQSTWEEGPQALLLADGSVIPGLLEGVVGMHPGGRRLITIPFADAFGTDGMPQAGLPAETDVVIIVDLLALT